MAIYEYDSQNDLLKRIAGGTLYANLPIGAEIKYAGSDTPIGFLEEDGTTFSTTDYPELYAVLGTNTLPNNAGWIIKAKNVGVPADFIKEVSKLNSYSTDEINTGKTWIDGKPIYRRAVQSSADIGTSSFSWAGVDSNIGANMDTCIKSYATYKNNGVTTTFDVRFFSTQGFMGIGSAINTGAYIILEYTKTTD